MNEKSHLSRYKLFYEEYEAIQQRKPVGNIRPRAIWLRTRRNNGTNNSKILGVGR
jgi:hypothetical protein